MATDNPRSTRVTRVAITTGDADARYRMTRFTPVLFYTVAVPTPPTPQPGWPGRANRAAFGAEMRDERPKADFLPEARSREIDAEQFNLSTWQGGGISQCAPKMVFRWEPAGDGPMQFAWAAFSWDQQLYIAAGAGSWPAYVQPVANGPGDHTFVFDAQVLGPPDADGVQQLQPLVLQGGAADVNPWAGGFRALAEFQLTGPSSFRVLTRRTDIGLDNQPFTVAVW